MAVGASGMHEAMAPKRSKNEHGFALPLFLLLCLVLVAALVLIWVLWGRQKSAHKVVSIGEGACTCADTADMENRLKQVNAAIAEYKRMIQEVKGLDAQSGKTTMYSDGLYQYTQENVLNAIREASRPTDVHGDTHTDCSTEVSAPTECLKGSLQTHENVHQATCKKTRSTMASEGNYRNTMTMAEFWNDEIAGYSAEIGYLNKNLAVARADDSCDWTCDVDNKTYRSHEVCERSCRPTLGSTIKLGFRCTQTKRK